MIFTDNEHRILLAALGKEEDFCKFHNEKSIIPICESIENKVSRLQNRKPYVVVLKDHDIDYYNGGTDVDLIIISYQTHPENIKNIIESCKIFFAESDYEDSQVEYIKNHLPDDCICVDRFKGNEITEVFY